MDALGNPERIAIARPRVARNELPWGKRAKRLSTLKGLNRRAGARTITPWHNHWPGYWFMPFFQQRTVVHFCATLPCAKNSTGTSAGYWPISNASRLSSAVSKTMFISCAPVAHLHGGRDGQGGQTRILAVDQSQRPGLARFCVAKWLRDFLHRLLANRIGAGIHRRTGGTSSQDFISR